MNIFKFKYAVLALVATVLTVNACKDYLDVNVDPNQSNSSRKDLQLTTSELYTSIGVGQRMFSNLNQFSQYLTGGPGVSLTDPDKHVLASSEGNGIFISLYRSSANLKFILDNNPNDKYYVAVAKILVAYNFQVCTDLFGDIPYTEALQGDADRPILNPKYDNAQTVVYPGIIQQLHDAVALIDEADGAAAGTYATPGTDDLIYGGDMTLWRKFATTLLLKAHLRSGDYAGATQAAADCITTNDEAAKIGFPGGSTGSNPFWTAANSTSLGNFYVATSTSVNYLNATFDPRIDYFYDKNSGGVHFALNPGDIEAASLTASFSRPAGAKAAAGGRIFGPTIPVFLVSGWEGNLLLAEAAVRKADMAGAEAAYDAAVAESFGYLGITDGSDTTYLKNKGKFDASSEAAAIKSIALQKWVCMTCIQPIESWIETRRFDNSANPIFASSGGIFIEPTKNSIKPNFPSILAYPENEESLNQSFPGQRVDLLGKVFWDK